MNFHFPSQDGPLRHLAVSGFTLLSRLQNTESSALIFSLLFTTEKNFSEEPVRLKSDAGHGPGPMNYWRRSHIERFTEFDITGQCASSPATIATDF